MVVMMSSTEVTSILNGPGRLAAVEHFKAMDTPTAKVEKVLVDLAEALGGDPLCAATYLDEEYQVFIATSDGPAASMHREVSHCQYVISTGAWLCVHDASVPVGPLLKVRRAILRGEQIAAYLGFQLTFQGHAIGAVCAADTHKRTWTEEEHFMVYQASIAIRDLIA